MMKVIVENRLTSKRSSSQGVNSKSHILSLVSNRINSYYNTFMSYSAVGELLVNIFHQMFRVLGLRQISKRMMKAMMRVIDKICVIDKRYMIYKRLGVILVSLKYPEKVAAFQR